jgi:hypothetical protein
MRARGSARARPSGEDSMKFVSDCLTGKDNLSSGQIDRFINAA